MIRVIKNLLAQGSLNFNRRPMQNAVLESLESTPLDAPNGFMYMNTTLGKPVIKTAGGDVVVGSADPNAFTWLSERMIGGGGGTYDGGSVVLPYACSAIKVEGSIGAQGAENYASGGTSYRYDFTATLTNETGPYDSSVIQSAFTSIITDDSRPGMSVQFSFDILPDLCPAGSVLRAVFMANPLPDEEYAGETIFGSELSLSIRGIKA